MDSRLSNRPRPDEGRPWQPGVGSRLPWVGVGALLVSVMGITASIGILVASDGQPISAWRFQPTVYLSIASTVTNIALHYALSEGVTVAWWNRAAKPNTKLGDLHRYWDFGNSLWAATTGGRHFNLIALACIFTAIAPINGPFLQRASTVTIASASSIHPLKVSIAPVLSLRTGYVSGRGYAPTLLTPDFSRIVQQYYNREDIQMNDTGCSPSGSCAAKVQGAGFAVNCSSYSVPFALEQSVSNGNYTFQSFFSWAADLPYNMTLNIQYKDTPSCAGFLTVRNCSLAIATVQYSVIIDGNRSTIALDPQTTIFDDVVSAVPQTVPVETNLGGSTRLGGFYTALNNKFDSTAKVRWAGASEYEVYTTGSTAPQFAVIDDLSRYPDLSFAGSLCHLHFRDPTQDLLQEARTFMFATAVASANSSNVQHVSSSQTATQAVFQSHYQFLAIAIVVTTLAILIVTATFHGYWHLGRNVTMSPIELAKAFNAPLLRNEDSNAEVRALVKRVGGRSVRYGTVVEEGDIAHGYDTKTVTSASSGQRQTMRLEIADESVIGAPVKGWRFSN